ncbi:hypothetical protein BXU06_02165 [Aquaspirillum sp. LM1]|nr:hypothetical protein BXU06_02165 [Aquaspirillum sp. LM1]
MPEVCAAMAAWRVCTREAGDWCNRRPGEPTAVAQAGHDFRAQCIAYLAWAVCLPGTGWGGGGEGLGAHAT